MPQPSSTISYVLCKQNELPYTWILISGIIHIVGMPDWKRTVRKQGHGFKVNPPRRGIISLRKNEEEEEKVTTKRRQVTDIKNRFPITRSLRLLQRGNHSKNISRQELRNERAWKPVVGYICKTKGHQRGGGVQ